MPYINTNIKVLREEARLSKEEFAEKMNVSVETVNLWEKGKLEPTDKEIEKMCPILRIHVEDFLERDILSERNDAGRRMKKGSSRSDYNWYFGSRSQMAYYVSYLVLVPVIFISIFLLSKNALTEIQQQYPEFITGSINLLASIYASFVVGFISAIYIFVYLFRSRIIVFRWWYIFWVSAIITIATIIGLITTPIIYVYAFYKGIIRKGKNR